MKIQVLSDLHQEFGLREVRFDQADLVILAGDIHTGIKGIQWIQSRIKEIPVIYILGNHEYYKGSYPKTLHKIRALAEGTNIHVLENESYQVDNLTFHGATLWTNFELFGDPRIHGSICQEKMNDYKLIRRDPSYSKLRSIDTYHMHKFSLRWIEKNLAASLTTRNIVVTHHAPSRQSIPMQYREDIVSSAYASDLETMILQYQPDYWIHGHIHAPIQYQIGNTHIVCNPQGYPHDPFNGFDPELIIDV